MFVTVNDTRIPLRELWRVCIYSMLSGSVYQYYWCLLAGRELRALVGVSRLRTTAWLLSLAVAEAGVLVLSSMGVWNRWGTTPAIAAFAAVLVPALWSAASLGGAVRDAQRSTGARTTAHALVVPLLLLAGLAIGAASVAPSAGLTATERFLNAFASGIVLPMWLVYAQHELNRALTRLGPTTDDALSFGALAAGGAGFADDAGALLRTRLARRVGTARAIERFAVVPWVTIGLGAVCTGWFAVQVARFGLSPSEHEMVRSGAFQLTHVRHGEWWRLATQHFVHFSVEHYAFNMFALAFTGVKLERALGHARTAATMLAGAAGATALSWLLFASMHDGAKVVAGGESGIGFAVIGALVACDPQARQAIGKLGRLMAVMCGISSLAPGVSYTAHGGGFAGGFVAAFAFAWLLRRGDAPHVERYGEGDAVPDVTAVPLAAGITPTLHDAPIPPTVAPPPVVMPPPLMPPPLMPPPLVPAPHLPPTVMPPPAA